MKVVVTQAKIIRDIQYVSPEAATLNIVLSQGTYSLIQRHFSVHTSCLLPLHTHPLLFSLFLFELFTGTQNCFESVNARVQSYRVFCPCYYESESLRVYSPVQSLLTLTDNYKEMN